MVKQFTIPCQFGQETSPVTLYIGHPETTHHPVHFQSEWLSSVKGGTIPQDLMDTLQKLFDLANENGADFEELCYYALISATQHSAGGVSPDDINKYADEFVKKEGNVDMGSATTGENANSDGNVNTKDGDNDGDQRLANNSVETTTSNNDFQSNDNIGGLDVSNTKTANEQQQMKDDLDTLSNTSAPMKDAEKVDNVFQSVNTESGNSNSTGQNNTDGNIGGEIVAVYSSEDEDLLLADDLTGF